MKHFNSVLSLMMLTTIIGMAQTYSEDASITTYPTGLYFQSGPGANNSSYNWTYPYGTKLTIHQSEARNFELMTTNKDGQGLAYRQWSQNLHAWTSWRKVLTEDIDGNVGIGAINATYKLTVNGKILAEEVKVVVDVPADYVFDKNYPLSTLPEVEKYIHENNHLPGIPSSAEIKENGWKLGEMSNKMLEKIEEITLYIIEQNKRLERLENLNDQLSNEIKLLRNEK